MLKIKMSALKVNKNLTSEIYFIVDDGSGCCCCFAWCEGYSKQFDNYLGKHVIIKGSKSSINRNFGIAIKDICKLKYLCNQLMY